MLENWHDFISGWLDYCNSLFTGVHMKTTQQNQHTQYRQIFYLNFLEGSAPQSVNLILFGTQELAP